MKYLKSYNESINFENSYNYKVKGTTEHIDKDGDKYNKFLYTFIDNNDRKYYVRLTSWEINYASFSADFQTEEEYLNDQQNKTDILDIKYPDTNRFDAFRVLSTVFRIIKDFYEYNIKTLNNFIFVTDDIKRRNIYKSIINKIFPAWKLIKDEKDIDGTWHIEYDFDNKLS